MKNPKLLFNMDESDLSYICLSGFKIIKRRIGGIQVRFMIPIYRFHGKQQKQWSIKLHPFGSKLAPSVTSVYMSS